MRKQLIGYLALVLTLVAAGSAPAAENRALLIAVPETPGLPEMKKLEGPENDVASLRRVLVENWGFRSKSVRTVRGSAATRKAILDALDDLVSTTNEGDRVLVYFSGHGVSAYTRQARSLGMRPDTGAIIPVDIKRGSPTEMLAGLIVGSRDLRPRFERLDDAGAETVVLFDACYSGDSAKSPPRLVPRSGQLFPSITEDQQAFEREFEKSLASAAPEWPYERVIYFAAAGRHELAWDIPLNEAQTSRPTIDGLAHGAFTNGLLIALEGAGDRDQDGRISYSELQEYLVGSLVSRRDSQTPQLRPLGKEIIERPVFGRTLGPARPKERKESWPLRVRVGGDDVQLMRLLESEASLVVTESEYDLEVRPGPVRTRVFLPNGADVGVSPRDRDEVVTFLRRRARAHRITNLSYPAQDMRLELLLEPEQGGVYHSGEVLSVGIRPGNSAWLLLLAIDSAGGVLPVFPFDPSQARLAKAGETAKVIDLAAVAPFGVELLELFAFRTKPAFYDMWIGRTHPLSEAETDRLYEMLQEGADAGGRARASRILYTLNR